MKGVGEEATGGMSVHAHPQPFTLTPITMTGLHNGLNRRL